MRVIFFEFSRGIMDNQRQSKVGVKASRNQETVERNIDADYLSYEIAVKRSNYDGISQKFFIPDLEMAGETDRGTPGLGSI